MKDQHQVLHKCLTEDVPAFVLTGKDVCAIATLKTYLQTAIEKGCSDEFVNDMVLVLREFENTRLVLITFISLRENYNIMWSIPVVVLMRTGDTFASLWV